MKGIRAHRRQFLTDYDLDGRINNIHSRGTGGWNSTPDRQETQGYDPNLDYLTSVDYGDGLPNQQQSWSYDAELVFGH